MFMAVPLCTALLKRIKLMRGKTKQTLTEEDRSSFVYFKSGTANSAV